MVEGGLVGAGDVIGGGIAALRTKAEAEAGAVVASRSEGRNWWWSRYEK